MNHLTRSLNKFGSVAVGCQLKPYSTGIVDSIDAITNLSKDQIELRHSVRRFIEKELPQNLVQKIDKEDNYAGFRDLWKKLGVMGFHGITVPTEYNGLDLGYLEHCIVMEGLSLSLSLIQLYKQLFFK